MRAIMSIVFMVLILVSSASAFLIETSTSIAGRDVAVMNNKISGGITISRMWGSPTYVKRTNTSFAGPYAIVGNRTSVITSALRKGSYFTISHSGLYARDVAVGRNEQCTRGTARCVNNTYEKCIGGLWVSTEQCKWSEICTLRGCRTGRLSRYPLVKITPIPIGRTIGAAN
ncbi:MAG: hypothetical protein QXR48_03865 [Candidatus Woesearchaeota archaeon]